MTRKAVKIFTTFRYQFTYKLKRKSIPTVQMQFYRKKESQSQSRNVKYVSNYS